MSECSTAAVTVDGATDWRSAIALISSLIWIGVTFGYTIPLCSLILEADGVSTTLNGAITAAPAVAMILIAPFVGRLAAAFGPRCVMLAAMVVTTATILLLPVFDNIYAWFPIRFAYGGGLCVLFVVSQTWFNQVIADEIRGRMIGTLVAVISIGIAAAPVILDITGYEGWAPFIIVSVITMIAALPLMAAREVIPEEGERHSPALLAKFLRHSPSAVWGAFLLGVMEVGVLGLLPIYSLRLGYSETEAVLLVSAYFAGGIILAVVLGWLADRMDRRTVLLFSAVLTLVTVLALPISGAIIIWPVVFLWGGAVVAIYSINLAILGQRFRGAELAAASAMLIFMMSVGNIVGPVSAGIAMDLWNPYGLLLILGAVGAAYALLVAYRRFAAPSLAASETPAPS